MDLEGIIDANFDDEKLRNDIKDLLNVAFHHSKELAKKCDEILSNEEEYDDV